MQRAPNPTNLSPSTDTSARPLYRFPDDTFSPAEIAGMDRLLSVEESEAVLAWMLGEGPEPPCVMRYSSG